MRPNFDVDEVWKKLSREQGRAKRRIITKEDLKRIIKIRNKSYFGAVAAEGGEPPYNGANVTTLKLFYDGEIRVKRRRDCICYNNTKDYEKTQIYKHDYIVGAWATGIPKGVPEITINEKGWHGSFIEVKSSINTEENEINSFNIVKNNSYRSCHYNTDNDYFFNHKIEHQKDLTNQDIIDAIFFNRDYGNLLKKIINKKNIFYKNKKFRFNNNIYDLEYFCSKNGFSIPHYELDKKHIKYIGVGDSIKVSKDESIYTIIRVE